MSDIKIAVIGDYNFTYNSHQATNLALDHMNIFRHYGWYYWIKTTEAVQHKPLFSTFHGIMFACLSKFIFLNGIIKKISSLSVPLL